MKKMLMSMAGIVVLASCSIIGGILASCSIIGGPDSDSEPSPEQRVTGVTFQQSRLDLEIGESQYIRYSVSPADVQNLVNARFDYNKEIISIDSDRYGVVVTAKKKGNTYLKATLNGITATSIISVEGDDEIFDGEPYIYSNFNVVELTPGSSATVSASLYGGTSSELEEMQWDIKDSGVASIDWARGGCVITARKVGSTVIKVKHPRAKYEYSMIVYVYADEMSAPYITTGQNVVVLNKAESSTKRIDFEVKNAYSPNVQQGFSYEIINNNGSENPFYFTANGGTALISPNSNGLAILRVKHEMCEHTLDVLVKVTTAVENVYIVPSTTTLEVIGSSTSYNIFAEIKGTDKYADPSRFVWEVEPDKLCFYTVDECMEWNSNGNQFNLRGKKNGVFHVKVSHELSEYSRKILVILREQDGSAIDASMYITTSQNLVKTQVGGNDVTLDVQIMGANPGDEAEIEWSAENPEVCNLTPINGKVMPFTRSFSSYTDAKLVISPLKKGETKVIARHPKVKYPCEIVVKVLSEYALLEEPMIIQSENSLLKILNGSTLPVEATLSGKYSPGDENSIRWTSDNESRIAVNPSTGKSTVLSARGTGAGQTYVSIGHEKSLSDKRILVLSADTQDELDSMKGIYSDKTYIRINVNDSAELELNQFGLSDTDRKMISWKVKDNDRCSVVRNSTDPLKATVAGLKEGKTEITASLQGSEPCIFYITVVPADESTGVMLPAYLTTSQNAIVLPNPGDTGRLSVEGINISGSDMMSTSWMSLDAQVATVTGNGSSATVTAVKEGSTQIKVKNAKSENELQVNVKVGALYEWADDFYTYIQTEEDTVTLVKGTKKTIGASLVNARQTPGFTFTVTGKSGIIDATGVSDGTCIIEGIEAGMTEVTIRHPNANFEKTILVVVSNTQEELDSLKYLTTEQNVITVSENGSMTVNATIKNASSEIVDGWHWKSNDNSKARVVESGSFAVIYGVSQGTVKVTVTNDSCLYPLEIIVNVVDPIQAALNPYIDCQNIVTLHVGDDFTELAAELIGGNESDRMAFSWHLENNSIAQLIASNSTARIKATGTGTTQIRISHPKANGIDRTVLVICEPEIKTDCYITVTESIIKMSPSDGTRTITANLVNGNDSDKYNFKWWADSYDILDMNYTSESAVITPVSTGTTTIHVSHPKAAYQKDIIIYISQYSEFAFETTSMSLIQGKQSFVNMHVPVSNQASRIVYSVYRTDGKTPATDMVSCSGTNDVCVLNPIGSGSCIVVADWIATNSGAKLGTAQLLLTIEEAQYNSTYINFASSTIITIEKDEVLKLSASLLGPKAEAGDDKFLKWKVKDTNILSISPAPSSSGETMNSEVQIKALKAGKETTITVTHSKADSELILYVIVPGENVANILLDRSAMNLIEGDSAQFITATLTNPAEGDYESLIWTVKQDEDSPAVKISGSGKKISVLPKKAGTAEITATVPSSMRKAVCTVSVEPPKTIVLDRSSFTTYPGGMFKVKYTVNPPEETNTVEWTISETGIISYSDDRNGTLTCIAKDREGTISLTGTTKSKAKAQIRVTNSWNENFSISKSLIRSVPVDYNDGTFVIDYEISPAASDIYVYGVDETRIPLDPKCYSEKVDNYLVIHPDKFDRVDQETGKAYGKIKLVPKREMMGELILAAVNNVTVDDNPSRGQFAEETIRLDVYYNKYNIFLDRMNGSDKNTSCTDTSIILGDGETLRIKAYIDPSQVNGSVDFRGIEFQRDNGFDPDAFDKALRPLFDNSLEGKAIVVTSGQNQNGEYTIEVPHDYCKENGYFGDVDDEGNALAYPKVIRPDQESNTNVVQRIYAGKIVIKYRPVWMTQDVEFIVPCYLNIRNARKNF